jgi:hypothetical protein
VQAIDYEGAIASRSRGGLERESGSNREVLENILVLVGGARARCMGGGDNHCPHYHQHSTFLSCCPFLSQESGMGSVSGMRAKCRLWR